MDYRVITDEQLHQIRMQQLLDIEAEHARQSLALDLARGVDQNNPQIVANLLVLERQHHQLWTILNPEDEPVSGNGSEPAKLASTP